MIIRVCCYTLASVGTHTLYTVSHASFGFYCFDLILYLICSRTPKSTPKSHRFDLAKFDLVGKNEALLLLDSNRLRDEVMHGTEYCETVLVWKGDQRTRTVLWCRCLASTLNFERKHSKLVDTNAWHVSIEHMHPDNVDQGQGVTVHPDKWLSGKLGRFPNCILHLGVHRPTFRPEEWYVYEG